MRVVIAAALALTLQPPPAAEPPLTALLARAGQHVRRFEQQFALVISDEDYQQHAGGRTYIGPQHRRTRAEMLFLWMPDEATWLTVRNVLSVDGREVAGSPNRLASAVGAPGAERGTRLRRLIDDNARFNVGRTFRNFNYPTLVLSFLDPAMQPRFTFVLAGRERVHGMDSWKVNYQERTTPTIIQGNGMDRISRGTVWIADGDGVLLKTHLELRSPRAESNAWATVDVEYQRDSRLDIWVPVQMREKYMEMRGSAVEEKIGGEATYSNFRRFETSGRVTEPR